jgi:hypothetical protein
MRLYEEALAADPGWLLPFLRLRVYLLCCAFEPARAARVLDDLQRHEPHNAVVPLERARLAFLAQDKAADGLAHAREAARCSEFSRSLLVAVPGPLRTALKFDPLLRELVGKGWPGYRWLSLTLGTAEHAQQTVSGTIDIALLRLRLAELEILAPDYSDEAQGISDKTGELTNLASLGDRLPAEQQALLAVRWAQHAQAFSDFPTTQRELVLSVDGISYGGYPSSGQQSEHPKAPWLSMRPPDGLIFVAPDPD